MSFSSHVYVLILEIKSYLTNEFLIGELRDIDIINKIFHASKISMHFCHLAKDKRSFQVSNVCQIIHCEAREREQIIFKLKLTK